MDAREQAELNARIRREEKMILFREGRLSFVEAEQITAELCAQGDQLRREQAEQSEREARQRGARLRSGGIG
jgi:hypothetical protein